MCDNKANIWKTELRDGEKKGGRGRRKREKDDISSVLPGVPEIVIRSTHHLFSYGELSHVQLSQFALSLYSSEQKESIWHKWVKTWTMEKPPELESLLCHLPAV